MVIDVHGHVSAPESLYAYKANLLSHRGAHGRGRVDVSDEQLREAVMRGGGPFGTHMSSTSTPRGSTSS
jgi:4-oxalmesaconate hydratase